VRNALNWSKQINERALQVRPGSRSDVRLAQLAALGQCDRIQEVMRVQRDTYANLNNQTLHYANLGVTINEIQNVYKLPDSLWQQWPAHSYHGSEQHNSARRDQPLPRLLGRQPGHLMPLSPPTRPRSTWR
jgi:alkyl sulfatase BDS1-like metallo-beta-lactamase superfamily hydrolase